MQPQPDLPILDPDHAEGVKAREHELTAVIGREQFERVPGDVQHPEHIERWRAFRRRYHEAQQLKVHDFPLQLDFEINSHCNLQCSFCLHGQETIKKNELGFERYARAIEEASEFGLCSVKLNYINEPLLVKDIDRYVRFAKDHGVLNVYFATNGILLTDDMARRLIDAGTSKIMISLDAATAETYRVMRGSKKFDKIIANIENLLDLRERLNVSWPLVRVNMLKTDDNLHEADQFIDFWTGKADMIGFQDKVGLPGVDEDILPILSDRMDHFQCSFPFKLMVVDHTGRILPCCTFSGREMPLGHIDTMTIKEAWDSKKMRDLKRLHQNGNYADDPICLHCIRGCG